MAEKLLTEANWKAFAKGKSLDDAALLKALAALGKADEADPRAIGKALDALDAALETLKKQSKADREATGHLADMSKAAARVRKDAEAAAERAERAEEEEASPALLTSKMLPLVRELRKGETRMHALITTAGKNTAVLIMRRAISPTRRKLTMAYVDAQGGAKHIVGECGMEDGKLTFVVQGQAGGLAKRITAALLGQVGLRLRVRVRGEDGAAEEDGEDAPEGSDGATPQTDAPVPEGSQGHQPPADPAREGFEKALGLLMPRIDQALSQRHPQSTKLGAVRGYAQEKAEAGDYAAAIKALGMIRQLLDTPATAAGGGDPAAREQALDGWRTQRDAVVRMLKDLAGEAAASGDPEAREVIVEISAVVKQLTAEPATRAQQDELMRWLQTDDVVADVDELAEPVREPLLARLRALQAVTPA